MSPEARKGWRGVIEEYRAFLPVSERTPVVTLLEGGTPLLPAPRLSERGPTPPARSRTAG
jgi:threonine synthase